jgi:hypothetical protein
VLSVVVSPALGLALLHREHPDAASHRTGQPIRDSGTGTTARS